MPTPPPLPFPLAVPSGAKALCMQYLELCNDRAGEGEGGWLGCGWTVKETKILTGCLNGILSVKAKSVKNMEDKEPREQVLDRETILPPLPTDEYFSTAREQWQHSTFPLPCPFFLFFSSFVLERIMTAGYLVQGVRAAEG